MKVSIEIQKPSICMQCYASGAPYIDQCTVALQIRSTFIITNLFITDSGYSGQNLL